MYTRKVGFTSHIYIEIFATWLDIPFRTTVERFCKFSSVESFCFSSDSINCLVVYDNWEFFIERVSHLCPTLVDASSSTHKGWTDCI